MNNNQETSTTITEQEAVAAKYRIEFFDHENDTRDSYWIWMDRWSCATGNPCPTKKEALIDLTAYMAKGNYEGIS